MKINGMFHAALWRGYVVLKPAMPDDGLTVIKLFSTKTAREKRKGAEIPVEVTLNLNYEKKTFKQLSAIFALVTAIYTSMNGEKPTEDEKYNLYLDLLEEYAQKVPSSLRANTKRPVHVSESNTKEAAWFIDGLLYHICTSCDLDMNTQAEVKDVFQKWEIWRGQLEDDPLDECSASEWRKRAVYSDASGKSGVIELCHIVSRGADTVSVDRPYNWLALTPEEHRAQHQYGWDSFLVIYPHLRGRVERARRLCSKIHMEQ